jgi:hypothetical protein
VIVWITVIMCAVAGPRPSRHLLAAQQKVPAPGGPDTRAAYATAVEKVEGLRVLAATIDRQRAQAESTALDLATLGKRIETSREALVEATAGIAKATSCRKTLSGDVEESLRALAEFQEAAQQALANAAELSRDPAAVSVRLPASSQAFRQRHDRKREITRRTSRLPDSITTCSEQLAAADAAVKRASDAFALVSAGTRQVLAALAEVRRAATLTAARVSSARSRGWLPTAPAVGAVPAAPALRRLSDLAIGFDGMARLQLLDPHPALLQRVRDYQDAALRRVVEEDAQQFVTLLAQQGAHDCSARECNRLLEAIVEQRRRVETAVTQAADRRLAVEPMLAGDAGSGMMAPDPGAWTSAQRSVETAFAPARAEVTPLLERTRANTDALGKSVGTAVDQALAERRSAYLKVFGVAEPIVLDMSQSIPTRGSYYSSSQRAVPVIPSLRRHAFEVLTLRATESEGYGAYTYVILPVRDRVTPQYASLLQAIVRLTPVARADEAAARRRVTNLFVIPGNSADAVAPDAAPAFAGSIKNYDWSRALSLVQIASDGALATGKVLEVFRKSPGPFLLTLPVPIEQATSVTNLLLADLNGYPAAGFDDLLKSYQNDLLRAFPTTQRLWRPPWSIRTALTLIRVGLMTGGQNFVAVGQR